jgi:hypothetical protein
MNTYLLQICIIDKPVLRDHNEGRIDDFKLVQEPKIYKNENLRKLHVF